MRAVLVFVGLLTICVSAAAWEVSEADSFGYRRAMVAGEGGRLAIVCPPDRAPFAVPVVEPRPDGGTNGDVVLGLEVDGVRHEQAMRCSEFVCEAELLEASWRALHEGTHVTLWYDDGRGPTLPLEGSAEALAACSTHF